METNEKIYFLSKVVKLGNSYYVGIPKDLATVEKLTTKDYLRIEAKIKRFD